jgi:tetratricopeptide (TPR) repeat protein
MERPKNIIMLLFILLTTSLSVFASYKTDIYSAYISNNMPEWKTTLDKMMKEKPGSNEFILELVNYQYGYIAWCIGNDKDKEAEFYLEKATENIELLEQKGFKPSDVSGYKSAFYGFRIGLATYKAPFLGPKSVKFAELSIEQDSLNPMGYIQYGNGQFHMPPIFGGSKKVAVEYFLKALDIMEKDTVKIRNDWNYLSLLALIGQSYVEMEEYQNAKKYFEKALKTEPDFLYVKLELLPDLIKKMNIKIP